MPWLRNSAIGAAVAVLLTPQLSRCLNYISQFRDDSRQRVRPWIAAELPRNARIFADHYADLGSDGDRVNSSLFVVERGNLSEMRQKGVDYVVLADISYQRFFDPLIGPASGATETFEQCRRRYAEIMQSGHLVWKTVPSPNMLAYTNPEIRVYRIRD